VTAARRDNLKITLATLSKRHVELHARLDGFWSKTESLEFEAADF
jgi:hypothetical protein